MRFTVISDTHGHAFERLKKLIPVFNAGEYLIHLGDGAYDLGHIMKELTCKVVRVRGNCDVDHALPEEYVLQTDAGKILFTHGHNYGVSYGDTTGLYYGRQEKDCKYAFYGHTHVANAFELNESGCFNPGSLGKPRLGKPSYCVATVEKGQLFANVIELND